MRHEKKVSICMMVKNEEKNLRRCLNSIKPVIDSGIGELVIIDTGSTDKSLEISKEYTDKVYIHPWENDFSKMRNISISYAVGEWVWIMDADEEIENPEEMIRLFKSDLSNYNTIIIKMKNYVHTVKGDEKAQYNVSILLRGFRNSKGFRYEGAIHEQPKNKPPFLTSDIVIGHYGYIWEDKNFTLMKFERTSGILIKELEKNPNNIYFQFQLAATYATIDVEKALEEIRKAHKLIIKLPVKERGLYIYVYGLYAKISYARSKYAETVEISREGLSYSKDYIDLWYYLAIALINIGDEETSLKVFLEYLDCKANFDKKPISKDPSLTFYCLGDSIEETALYNISVIYLNKKDFDNCLKYARKIKPSTLKAKVFAKIATYINMKYVVSEYLKEVIYNKEGLNEFTSILEMEKYNLDTKVDIAREVTNFYETNQVEEDTYYLLNLVRLNNFEEGQLNSSAFEKMAKLDYNKLEEYYGDLLIYVLRQGLDLNLFLNFGEAENITRFLKYLSRYYSNIFSEVNIYLNKHVELAELKNIKYWIVIARNILLSNELDDDSYMKLFMDYVSKGIDYIHLIYAQYVLERDLVFDISNKEHRFFFYLERANKAKESDTKLYIRFLRKALAEYPIKRAIEMLLREINTKTNSYTIQGSKQKEFEEYKEMVKKNINTLIESNRLEEARSLIDEYLKIVPDDIVMLTLKSEVLLSLLL